MTRVRPKTYEDNAPSWFDEFECLRRHGRVVRGINHSVPFERGQFCGEPRAIETKRARKLQRFFSCPSNVHFNTTCFGKQGNEKSNGSWPNDEQSFARAKIRAPHAAKGVRAWLNQRTERFINSVGQRLQRCYWYAYLFGEGAWKTATDANFYAKIADVLVP
jgi:hypothetical protein